MRKEDRPSLRKTIRSYEDVLTAVKHYCGVIPYDLINATAQGISTEIRFGQYTETDFEQALRKRDIAGSAERDIYTSVIFDAFLKELERYGDRIVFQFSVGAESLPFESGMRLRQDTIGYIADFVATYPGLKFMCFNASRAGHQSLCTLVRELPNFSLAGFWWHSFFPGALMQCMEERLDMVPLNRQCGYVSDAYCVDWVYGKNRMILSQYARVFTDKIEAGQYGYEDVREIAKYIFYYASGDLLSFPVKE